MTLAERYSGVLGWFAVNRADAETELHYDTVFQLLVSVMLSAQCTDRRVNSVTPALFDRFPTAETMASASSDEILKYIHSVSYPNSKAQHLAAAARMIMSDFGGEVPADITELQKLPGVGRKTANVVGAVAYGCEVMPVDTHVFRVSARIGLTRGAKNPLQTELQLERNIPSAIVPKAHHWLLLHGRYVCTARNPKCSECGISEWCAKHSADLRKSIKK